MVLRARAARRLIFPTSTVTSRASIMPAPGPKDGHMSKSSRDLSKGIAVKSNGFKHGGATTEGWGTHGGNGRRLGKGNGARDVLARQRARELLERRRRAAAEAAEAGEDPSAARGSRGGVGNKRKRGGGVGGEKKEEACMRQGEKKMREEEEEAARGIARDMTSEVEASDAAEEATAVKEAEAEACTDEERYACKTCGVRCGTKANYDAHCDSKKHKAGKQREKGKAILAALKAARK